MSGRRIVLWRHGRTPWNAVNRFQGQEDVPLDEVGHQQAERAARLLAGLSPSAVVSSDLQRARDTAAPLLRITGVTATYDVGLRETYAGAWQGRTGAELLVDEPVLYRSWLAGEDVSAGGGETRSEVAERAVVALQVALTRIPDGGVLVAVTHGGTARAAIGRLLGLPVASWAVLGGLANCSWSVLEESRPSLPDTPPGGPGSWRLSEHNAGSLPETVVGDDR